ncbi:UbiH/UbiF family hydroxylase [Achromobacter insolitus]|jgi:ubiquinone biosynthesis UbiH/UbiF/VisC/COQ6 family hydroxylase|uniref:UbiH/UbiF family hydroxylase n=2 Tax=Achromobacter insolitus TaxID=217204 RepID=UPI0007C32CBB|nr:UbiH/UbiF family hydroxylase [Achromobacter insolitus]APX78204.1 ubiquinone biosynthesis protein UbiH [Achromobacter insolitus]MDH3062027.1 UbiH/UbiF family hydroxylase [Achromobacter insolitus]OAD17622.1 ubiquinone biosynthesis protein UbiH [Achromobacter insolitus]OWT62683.1 ubiquinone biosynthesis protein UbiH [Achromobacter insolitus]WKK18044.1 UbiH/UbiF family hydroxylase [Achromobacter insolitus]
MSHQIVVCGAGIVGLSTALALARRGQRVAVLAPRANVPPADADRYHPRVYAISPASQRFLAELGVWDAMPASRLTPVTGMEIHGDADGQVNLSAWQAALPQLAWIVESGEIERVLIQAVRMFGIPWLEDRCTGYRDGAIDTESGARIEAELFVGADGAASPLREAAGLKHESVSYHDTGLVVHLDAERPHQGTAFQWFRDDGVLALLPLPDTSAGPQVSMVWSMRAEPAQALLALPPEEQAARLETLLADAAEGRLGALKVRSKLHGFPLTLERAQMVAPGIALAGDAAHRLHPLAGQGLNLGLGDVEALARIVAGREAYRAAGDLRVLHRYQRARAEPVLAMRLATDGLHKLFASRATPLVWLRNAGMHWVERTPLIKRRLITGASAN